MTRTIKLILISIVLAVLAGGGWFIYQNFFAGSTSTFPNSAPDASASATTGPLLPARTPPAGQAEYRNEQYRFALFYPQELAVKTYDEGNGASTVTISNSDESQSFQIFIVPYDKTQVDQARFKMDEPSGVLGQPTNVVVGGAQAVMFFGNNAIMGDTREVWFVRGGYLFEVTTYKDLDAWLSQIMATWEFI
jgi:hypothetical protein